MGGCGFLFLNYRNLKECMIVIILNCVFECMGFNGKGSIGFLVYGFCVMVFIFFNEMGY